MSTIHTYPLLAGSLLCASALSAQTNRAKDTIDVPVGSSVIDFSKHTPGASRAVQQMTAGGQQRSAPAVIWSFTFTDTGAHPLLFVRAQPEAAEQTRGETPVYVFDRKTLALREIADRSTMKPMVTADGGHITGEVPGPNGPMPLDVSLSAPAFYRPLADLVTESLPKKLGVVFRVPLWGPPATSAEQHLYEFIRREPITVLGHEYRDAWVLEDRSADGSRLNGTMWIVDAPPHLVRWVINQPNGATIQLDQERGR
jgi:hypothetical protein